MPRYLVRNHRGISGEAAELRGLTSTSAESRLAPPSAQRRGLQKTRGTKTLVSLSGSGSNCAVPRVSDSRLTKIHGSSPTNKTDPSPPTSAPRTNVADSRRTRFRSSCRWTDRQIVKIVALHSKSSVSRPEVEGISNVLLVGLSAGTHHPGSSEVIPPGPATCESHVRTRKRGVGRRGL